MTEDFSLAAELIERAVLVLESSLHPSFSLTNGNCRLDYKRQENRAMFVVLFKHAQYLEARACCRTAFEISKLIFLTQIALVSQNVVSTILIKKISKSVQPLASV